MINYYTTIKKIDLLVIDLSIIDYYQLGYRFNR